MAEFIQVTTTVELREDAEELARLLLAERLVSCVQISAVCSHYHWHGSIEQTDEYVLVMKSRRNLFTELEQFLLERHPYDTPEIIAVPIVSCSAGYLQWMNDELKTG